LLGGHDGNNPANWMIQARSRLALRRAQKPATKAARFGRFGQISKPLSRSGKA